MNKYTLIDALLNNLTIDKLNYSKIEIMKCMRNCDDKSYIKIGYEIEVTKEGKLYHERKKREYKLNRILK